MKRKASAPMEHAEAQLQFWSSRATFVSTALAVFLTVAGLVWSVSSQFAQFRANDARKQEAIDALQRDVDSIRGDLRHNSATLMKGLVQIDRRLRGLPPQSDMDVISAELK